MEISKKQKNHPETQKIEKLINAKFEKQKENEDSGIEKSSNKKIENLSNGKN